MLVKATELQQGQTFQIRYEKRWSNKITVKEVIGLDFPISWLSIATSTGKTKLIKRTEMVRVVA
jgi:hypothetical protein